MDVGITVLLIVRDSETVTDTEYLGVLVIGLEVRVTDIVCVLDLLSDCMGVLLAN